MTSNLHSSQERWYPLLKAGCLLLDICHMNVLAFSHIVLHATFLLKFLFVLLISFLGHVAYIMHVSTSWGSYGIICVDLKKFCTTLYWENHLVLIFYTPVYILCNKCLCLFDSCSRITRYTLCEWCALDSFYKKKVLLISIWMQVFPKFYFACCQE